jgi:spore maturation protein CgeB
LGDQGLTEPKLDCVFLGLAITSTWGNGHATTYRALLKEFAARGHKVTFLERDVPWYAENREFSELPYCTIGLYSSLAELHDRFGALIRNADMVTVGSYVPDGIAVGDWVTSTARNAKVFYDIDTPVTLANLKAGRCEYLSQDLCRKYDLYLSFTGGPTLTYIESKLHSPCARPLYCCVDPSLYFPQPQTAEWDIAYLGTYAEDRQPALERLLLDVARSHPERNFAVAGPQYPDDIQWPANVARIHHLPASEHRQFYNSQTFTLNLTRRDMIRAGYSPSVRLFEAAACGVPILTDEWPGLDSFFTPGSEILPVRVGEDVTSYLQMRTEQRMQVAEKARKRTLHFHTASVRARELGAYILTALERLSCSNKRSRTSVARSETAALI